MPSPRGPTFVSIPVDDWERACAPISPRPVSRRIAGDPALLERAAAQLCNSRRPVIVVGASVARADAWEETIALAEQHQAAVWVSTMCARNSFLRRHALFPGFLPANLAPLLARLQGAD